MYCENCGKKIPDGSKFCPECGAPVHHEEESLITKARRGDNAAIQQLMNQYRGMIRYQARMYVKNEDDVNEIEQQVYIKAFSKTSDLADEKRFGGWLKTIAINTAKDYVTSAFKKRSVMFTDLDDTNNDMVYDARDERIDHRPEVQMDETARQEIIMKVLQDLPQDQQDVIVMHFYNDLSFREIAEELGVPMSTVTGRAQQAKNSIKASVTAIQNRDGIKLYHLSPLAFFIWLLGLEKAAPVEPPVIGKTVRIDPQKVAAKDKPYYGNPESNVGKTVRAEKAVKTTAKTAVKATAGKAAGAGFLATTAGKAIIAGAIAVAAAGGGAAGIHYHNTKTAENKIQESEKKSGKTGSAGKKITSDMVSQSVKKSDSKSKAKSNIVWVKEPGKLDIDDFEDLDSTGFYPEYTTSPENTGYSPTWIGNNVFSYTGNGIIIKKNNLVGTADYDGNVIADMQYSDIYADPGSYVVTRPEDKDNEYADIYVLDSDFTVKNMGSGYGGDAWYTKTFISGNTVYKLSDFEEENAVMDVSQYEANVPTILPVINGYQSGDVDLNSVSGFKLLQSGSKPVNLPDGMTPVYYSAVKGQSYPTPSEAYNTCFVNDVIKLQDQKKKIHLWNAKTHKYVSKQAFDDATFYEDGYIGVKKNGKWAFMDMSGNTVTDYLFDKVSGLFQGKVYVKYQGKAGILNLKETVDNLNGNKKQNEKKTSDQKKASGQSQKSASSKQSQNADISQVAGKYVLTWGTIFMSNEITVSQDGSFTGTYSVHVSNDADGHGSESHSGKFKMVKKLDDHRYQLSLEGNNDTEGLTGTQTFTLVLPGYSYADLSPDIQGWVRGAAGQQETQNGVTTKKLIINDSTNEAFVEE